MDQGRRFAMQRRRDADADWHPNQDKSDPWAVAAGHYRAEWITSWAAGDRFKPDFEETTPIPPMRFTDDNPDPCVYHKEAMQILSIKIASIRGCLRWPLEVFGMVAARDVLDLCMYSNIIFARARNNCQTITEEHPYLELTGPTRAVVVHHDPGELEVVLRVKGRTESEDRDLSFLLVTLSTRKDWSFNKDYTSKLSTLQLNLRHVPNFVEATIGVRLVGWASWPDGFQGVLTASTTNIDDLEVSLLASGADQLPIVADDGTIKLSRRVVSVQRSDEKLTVSIVAQCEKDGLGTKKDHVVFMPKNAGRSVGKLNVGACKMQVTGAWSLF